jgi:hypothetical protein
MNFLTQDNELDANETRSSSVLASEKSVLSLEMMLSGVLDVAAVVFNVPDCTIMVHFLSREKVRIDFLVGSGKP